VLVVFFMMRPRPSTEAPPAGPGVPATPTTPVAAVPTAATQNGDEELRQAIAEADRLDPGWRFEELEAKRATIPDNENGALVIVRIKDLLKPKPGGPQPPEGAGNTDLAWKPEQRAALNTWLKKRAAALQTAIMLAGKPNGRFKVDNKPDFLSTPLPYVQTTRETVALLNAEAARQNEEGNPAVLQTLHAMLNSGRALGDEPFFISQVIRRTCIKQSVMALERVLARQSLDTRAWRICRLG
jgi:hypothetical protein